MQMNECKEITLKVLLVPGSSANAILDQQYKQTLPFTIYLF
jgi:hypothetical protein